MSDKKGNVKNGHGVVGAKKVQCGFLGLNRCLGVVKRWVIGLKTQTSKFAIAVFGEIMRVKKSDYLCKDCLWLKLCKSD